jgi:lipopolysaccharide transport system ATP-binding protein
MNDEVLIKVENVSKKFCRDLKQSLWYGLQDITSEVMGRKYDRQLRENEFWSVDNVSFELKRGECLGLIGPNGAGKSTLLKMLNGLLKPDKGRIEMRGRVGALIELSAGFNSILTGRENIYSRGTILGFTKAEIDRKMDAIIEFSELGEFIDTPVINYSSGMRVRLGFAIAAQMEPDILLLDEVLAVGDVGFRAKCFNTIYQMIQNAAVILVTHTMPQVSRVCSDILVMNHGVCTFKSKDVPKGIDLFYSYFEGEETGIVTGSGRAVIHQVELESNNQTNVEVINYLDDLIVNLDATIDPDIEFVSVGVTILGQELQNIAQCNSHYHNVKIPNSGQRMHIRLNLGQINLNPGIYSISIGIQSEAVGEVLTNYYNFKKFRVNGSFFGYAPIQIKGNWQF